MPQSTYSNYHSAAIAGQVVSKDDGMGTRGRYECSEDLNFGRVVELHTDGTLRQPQTAGAAAPKPRPAGAAGATGASEGHRAVA